MEAERRRSSTPRPGSRRRRTRHGGSSSEKRCSTAREIFIDADARYEPQQLAEEHDVSIHVSLTSRPDSAPTRSPI
jgi:hypothetical protein